MENNELTVEPTPEQARAIALGFMAQSIGEIKQLDNFIVNKTPTLQGRSLDPQKVLDSIAVPTPEPSLTVNPMPNGVLPSIGIENRSKQLVSVKKDTDQLEFSFEDSPISKKIFDELGDINKKLNTILDRLDALEVKKKAKKSQVHVAEQFVLMNSKSIDTPRSTTGDIKS